MANTTWKQVKGVGVAREDYTATVKGDGYLVRQFVADVGKGDRWHASVRCKPIGEVVGYATVGAGILACLEHAGVAGEAGRHGIVRGWEHRDVDFRS